MADMLNFKKGLFSELGAATKKAGTIYITTDEHAMYVDVDNDTRIRIGDFIEVQNIEALKTVTPWSTTALYYLKDENALCKYTGSEWKVINDLTSIKSDITAHGNAITQLQKDVDAAEATIAEHTTAIAANKSATETNAAAIAENKANIATNASGIASNKTVIEKNVSDISAMGTRVTANEAAIKKLQDDLGTVTSEGIKELSDRLDTVEGVVGDAASGLVKDVADLKTTTADHGSKITANTSDIAGIKTTLNEHLTKINANADGVAENKKAISDLETEILEKMQTADAMTFKGTVGTGGTIASLPTSGVSVGDTYKVIAAGTYGGQACKVGDLLIAQGTETDGVITSGLSWVWVPSGDEAYEEAFLKVTDSNAITLGDNNTAVRSTVTFKAAENSSVAISSSAADGSITIGMEWGTF